MKAVEGKLQRRMEMAEKQSGRFMREVRDTYNDLMNPDYPLAERRLLGIISHYRQKEKLLMTKYNEEQKKHVPTARSEMTEQLSKRKAPTKEQAARTTRRNRSRSRSRSRGAASTSESRSRAPRPRQSGSRQETNRGNQFNQSRRGRGNNRPQQSTSRNFPSTSRSQDTLDMGEELLMEWFRQRKDEEQRQTNRNQGQKRNFKKGPNSKNRKK